MPAAVPPASIPPPPLASPFRELEFKYARISRDFAEGKLALQDYREALQALVVQDARGYWSFSTGRWMWYDGAAWVDREPQREPE